MEAFLSPSWTFGMTVIRAWLSKVVAATAIAWFQTFIRLLGVLLLASVRLYFCDIGIGWVL